MTYPLITILGPTATGKTTLAAHLAIALHAEIISADSRQVYRGMTIGTGKDLIDYTVDGVQVPYHLIDILDAGAEYNIFSFQKDVHRIYDEIKQRNTNAILCGGSGMYIEAVLCGYHLPEISDNNSTLEELEKLSDEELIDMLASMEKLHNSTDTKERSRLVQAVALALKRQQSTPAFAPVQSIIFGIQFDRTIIRERITKRLHERLNEGMIEEVQALMDAGVSPDQLKRYGLEYKYVTLFIEKDLSYDEMFNQLNTAIHRFAKRQMTWFRRMERNGLPICWIDGTLTTPQKIDLILMQLSK